MKELIMAKKFEGIGGSYEFYVYDVTEKIDGIPERKRYLLEIYISRFGVSQAASKVYENLDFLKLIEKDIEMLGFKEVEI